MQVPPVTRPAAALVERFRELLQFDSVACELSDCMGRFGAMSADVRPLFDGIRCAGPAVTARTLAIDLAAVFKATDVAEPGAARARVAPGHRGQQVSHDALQAI